MNLPAALPAWDPPILPIARQRSFAFTVDRPRKTSSFRSGVDGAPFTPEREIYTVQLDR
ncbi:MAG: hypothetical protein R2845_00900 [Thermomicrobiales bacterium]